MYLIKIGGQIIAIKPAILSSISRRNVRNFILVIVFVLLTIVSLQEQILGQVEADLGNHMIIEHLLFFFLGVLSVMIAERLIRFLVSSNNENSGRSKIQGISNKQIRKLVVYYWSRVLQRIFLLNSYRFIWPLIAIALIAIWHIPATFDFAILYKPAHILQHLSFVAVGVCSLMAIRCLGESFSLFVLFLLIGMMGLGGLMFTLAETKIYDVYSISSHNNAGNYMLISSIALLLVGLPTYLIHRTFLHTKSKY
ncbi:MAG TPA: hypothetical protein VE544_11670 [Nitrososphaeraceae archaeon]|jgi:hypothetical protein|nr:hypothetical protein [Nitrososphaeraceae archaeon]